MFVSGFEGGVFYPGHSTLDVPAAAGERCRGTWALAEVAASPF